jgi:hypothetical protein
MKKTKCSGCNKLIEKPLDFKGHKYCYQCWEEVQALKQKKTKLDMIIEDMKTDHRIFMVFTIIAVCFSVLVVIFSLNNMQIYSDISRLLLWTTIWVFQLINMFRIDGSYYKREMGFMAYSTLIPIMLTITAFGKEPEWYPIALLVFVAMLTGFMVIIVFAGREDRMEMSMNKHKAQLLDWAMKKNMIKKGDIQSDEEAKN